MTCSSPCRRPPVNHQRKQLHLRRRASWLRKDFMVAYSELVADKPEICFTNECVADTVRVLCVERCDHPAHRSGSGWIQGAVMTRDIDVFQDQGLSVNSNIAHGRHTWLLHPGFMRVWPLGEGCSAGHRRLPLVENNAHSQVPGFIRPRKI